MKFPLNNYINKKKYNGKKNVGLFMPDKGNQKALDTLSKGIQGDAPTSNTTMTEDIEDK